jgi:hypothetical protein
MKRQAVTGPVLQEVLPRDIKERGRDLAWMLRAR